nr:hypothetical protein GCM10017745_41540 [Saccharothrix mutabilis subsp. capreolus]
MANDPGDVLDGLSALRRRVRGDRSGYWLPFLLFGLVVAGAVPWYLPEACEAACTWSSAELPALWHWLHPTARRAGWSGTGRRWAGTSTGWSR